MGLLPHVFEWRPEVAASSGSVEAARIAYGLGIPHILVSDTPHSPVNRLTAPVSRRVMTPWVIPRSEWVEAGAKPGCVRHYKALDPWFWLRRFKPDKRVLKELGVEEMGYVLLRMPETAAAYLSAGDEEVLKGVERLARRLEDYRLVVLCRYRWQAELARKALKDALIVDKLLPGASLIYYSALFVGGGGTMTQEAAILGVPALSFYPGKLPTVVRFLEKRGLVEHYRGMVRLAERLRRFLRDIEEIRGEWSEKARRLREVMRPPEEAVVKELEAAVSG